MIDFRKDARKLSIGHDGRPRVIGGEVGGGVPSVGREEVIDLTIRRICRREVECSVTRDFQPRLEEGNWEKKSKGGHTHRIKTSPRTLEWGFGPRSFNLYPRRTTTPRMMTRPCRTKKGVVMISHDDAGKEGGRREIRRGLVEHRSM